MISPTRPSGNTRDGMSEGVRILKLIMFRFVLYGRPGCGKSVTLSHLTHYAHSAGFITLTFSQIKKWLTRYYTTAPSTHNPGQVDHIMNSNIFLKNFKQANLERLSDPRLVTHKVRYLEVEVSFVLSVTTLGLHLECPREDGGGLSSPGHH